MKFVALLMLLLITVSCNQKTNVSDNSVNCPETIKKFEDPERVLLCKKFLRYMADDNLLDSAQTLFKVLLYHNSEMVFERFHHDWNEILKVRDSLRSYKIAPEENWTVRFDTLHTKVDDGEISRPYIEIYESILVPIDKRSESVRKFLAIIFDVTELNPPKGSIYSVALLHDDMRNVNTNRDVQ